MKIRILTSICLLMLACQAAHAGPQPPPNNPRRAPATKGQVVLDHPPDLPYLPPYPQADYSMINSRPNDPGGPGYEIVFFSQNSAAEVLTWYKSTFARNAWQLEGTPNEKYISALRKNICCSVNAIPSWKKNFRTQVILGYKIFSKETPDEPGKK